MASIVAVHGVGQQYRGENTLKASWLPAAQDGLLRAGASEERTAALSLELAFYGDLFRGASSAPMRGLADRHGEDDLIFQEEVLLAWWAEAARLEPHRVESPTGVSGRSFRSSSLLNLALRNLLQSRFFAGITENALVGSLRQVSSYFSVPTLRSAVRERVLSRLEEDTIVVVGHSLGSVVAYEALCSNHVNTRVSFVSLGSPLGMPRLIFDRLDPRPTEGKGIFPHAVSRWVNIADQGDIVALEPRLDPLFESEVEDFIIDNGPKAHDVQPYLTAAETGRAIAEILSLPL